MRSEERDFTVGVVNCWGVELHRLWFVGDYSSTKNLGKTVKNKKYVPT